MIVITLVLIGIIWLPKKNKPVTEPVDNKQATEQNTEDQKIKEPVKKAFNFELVEIPQEKEYDLTYENKNIKIIFDPKDAIIKHAYVKDTFLNREEVRSYDIVQPRDENEGALRLKFGSWENKVALSNLTGGKNIYHYERIGNTFIFKCNFKKINDNTSDEELIYTVIKKYEFIEDENIFKLDIEIFNNKNQTLNFDSSDVNYSIGWGPLLGIDSREKKPNRNIINMFSYFNGKSKAKAWSPSRKETDRGILFKSVPKEADNGWVSSDGHYFASLILPDNQNYKYFYDYRDMANKNYYCGFSRNTPKSNLKSTFYIYIGPKIGSILKRYDNFKKGDFNIENSHISALENKIMYGIGNIIGKILEFIYKYVKNYGFAIIILTILIKLLLSPLTHKSMVSQQRMSELQPKIKELQEKYKDNPQLLNKETMALYKKEKINPLGGCLPMLLQLPILFAMFRLLNSMVALKGAKFIFWIKDLSVPDSILNFGFTIPILNMSSLNILPILMVGVQIISSYFMQDSQSNKQAKMMMWFMTIFIFVIFYNAASALVLYWTVMNILNLGQQIYLKKFQHKEK